MSTTTKERVTAKAKAPASRPYRPWLRERLATDPQEARLYLEAAFDDEDPRVFLVALKDVVEASGGIGPLAKTTGLNRENLYRMLSKQGNPELASLSRVLQALGLRLTVEPVEQLPARSARRRGAPHRASAKTASLRAVGSRR